MKFIEEYEPEIYLNIVCEWYDFCREYDKYNKRGIRYIVNVFKPSTDKYSFSSEQIEIFLKYVTYE